MGPWFFLEIEYNMHLPDVIDSVAFDLLRLFLSIHFLQEAASSGRNHQIGVIIFSDYKHLIQIVVQNSF